ncbi:unnamed protein product [Nesidiocoris tenuis]|uniref:Uncharacterized protein n=1 Tax=Nesidiocoris tenuis TaxID=355587 RepID=A0A6H5H6R1_9HEMI|nr:unnamed protein product [Nesidiocoris tenuis]
MTTMFPWKRWFPRQRVFPAITLVHPGQLKIDPPSSRILFWRPLPYIVVDLLRSWNETPKHNICTILPDNRSATVIRFKVLFYRSELKYFIETMNLILLRRLSTQNQAIE